MHTCSISYGSFERLYLLLAVEEEPMQDPLSYQIQMVEEFKLSRCWLLPQVVIEATDWPGSGAEGIGPEGDLYV
jgi:hypothetical protein